MGFGTLLIGYFFIINPVYFQYTDIIGALVMLLGLYKLSAVNKSFYSGMITSIVFSLLSFAEIVLTVLDMFNILEWTELAISYMGAVRYAIIFVLTLFILRGVYEISAEVDADELAKRAKASIPLSAIYIAAAILEMPFLSKLPNTAIIILNWVVFIVLISIFIYVINVLLLLYRAYMQICMPEELEREPKKSKFGFMNRYWDRLEEKNREYAEYKLNAQKNKKKKRKK